jgi:hypothetical protein
VTVTSPGYPTGAQRSQASFSDLPALVRRTIWAEANSVKSTPCGEQVIISCQHWERIFTQLASIA